MTSRSPRPDLRLLALSLAALGAVACGKSPNATGNGAETDAALDPIRIPKACRGFPMEGIRYSPGGDVLPNTCEPFDATKNNPYAVRCVDVLGFETPYVGDEFCILPPPPDLGAQVGMHPGSDGYWTRMGARDFSSYRDARATAEFEVAPGDEIEQTYATNLHNPEAKSWYRIDARMRTGSHHLATYRTTIPEAEGFRPPDGSFSPEGADEGFLWNAQRSDSNRPVSTLEIPDDDVGLGSPVDAEQGILLDVHHINTGDAPILRETWINLWWVDGAVLHPVDDHPFVAPVDVPPDATTVLEQKYSATSEMRVLSLFGHRHAWTRRFNAWVHRASGVDEPVYESFDWREVPTYSYDRVSKNPTPDVARGVDGGSSGLLVLEPGDELVFDCHVDTTAAHAAELGVPAPTAPLAFGNKAFAAEMCILYAQTVQLGPLGDASGP